MIEIKNLNCYYNRQLAVEDVNLFIEEGEMVSLVGPSGCGKTTLLRSICGLQEEVEGDILISGKSVIDLPPHKRSTLMVFQEYLLYPHLTVVENIGFGLKMQGIKKRERLKRVMPFISKMGLDGLEKRYPNELSGGQRQRVALARALAVEPKVLLLDEPFSNLDEQLREEMRRFVCELQEELKITTIFVTHDIEEALMSSRRVVVMQEGQVQQIGKPETLYKAPVNYTVAKMLGTRSFIEGTLNENRFLWDHAEIPQSTFLNGEDLEDGKYIAVLTPEMIHIGKLGEGISARVEKVVFGGSKFLVTFKIGEDLFEWTLLPPQTLRPKEEVVIGIDWHQAVLVKK